MLLIIEANSVITLFSYDLINCHTKVMICAKFCQSVFVTCKVCFSYMPGFLKLQDLERDIDVFLILKLLYFQLTRELLKH